ncbi:immunoglobulin-like domain-containing protein [Listeria booriae]|uniref:immunoglobulin-like domain-containing protein n=1 Tax=Listeria booriae TaxID=1552123 RepID=UPI0016245399|nr:immunoglobulin-like domain-containing protein [Listeria booriae]MBC1801969.1 hypothetical protein [Listeria booriae]
MNKKQTLKRVATAVITANVLASTFITSLPAKSFAAENPGTSAEQRLVGSGLQATSTNLIKNPQFNGLNNWDFRLYHADYSTIFNPTTPDYNASNGWYNVVAANQYFWVKPNNNNSIDLTMNVATGWSSQPVGHMIQTVDTVAGRSYTLTYNQANLGNGNIILQVLDGTDITFTLPGFAQQDTTWGNHTLTFTAKSDKTTLRFRVYRASSGSGSERVSNLNLVDNSATVINAVKDTDTVVSGTGMANGTVVVKNTTTGEVIGNGTVNAQGIYIINIPKQPGNSTVQASVTNAGGLTASDSTKVIKTIVDKPVINAVTDYDTHVTGTGEPGTTVKVNLPDGTTKTGTVASDGKFDIAIPKQTGDSVISVTLTDGASGVESAPGTTTVVKTIVNKPILNTVTDRDTHVTGTGKAGTTVKVTLPDGTTKTGTVDSDGKFDITIPKQVKDAVISATLTDEASGVESSPGTTRVVHDGPATPVLDRVTNISTKVTGTGDPGNRITIKVKDGGSTISYTGFVDDFGEFSIAIDTPEAGATVEAIAKDSANVLSDIVTKTVVDVIAPNAPTVQAVSDSDTKVTGSGEANCDVTVTLPSGGTVTGTTDADGKFSITIPKQTAGRDIKVNLTDAAGNVGAATTVTVQTDVLANPTVNRISNQDTKATGTGVAGATVTLTANGHDYTTEVGADGKYEVTIPKLAAGLNVVVKQAKNGKTSGSVNTIVQDDRTPAKPAVNPVKDSDTKATGTGTAGDTIKVKLPNGDVATGVVEADGTWSVTIPAQAAGSELDVTATGPNGKTSDVAEVTVAQTLQTGTLTTNDFTMGRDQYIVGSYTGDVKKFRITIGDKVYEGGSLDTARKTYTFYAVDKAVEGNFTIAALDKYGNVLDTKTAKMIRQSTRTPVAPVVNPVKDSDTKATGTGVAGDTITVKLPNGDTKTGVVAADGTWSITIPAQAAGAKIDVTATTPDNKVSPATTVTIGQTTQVGAITTANDFTVGTDKYITGKFTGAIKSLRVTIGTNVYTGGTLDTTAGTFSFYALATATAAGTYKIEGLDKYGNVISTKTANIIKNSGNTGVGTGTVSANGFVIHTDKNVTGTITGDVKTLRLVYDGVTYTGGTIAADKTFTFYALDKILNKSKSARIDGYDANGNKIATSTITLSDSQDNNSGVGSGTVTADDFNVGTDRNITGKYTGDVKSIKVRVGDVTYSGGTLTDGNFTFYASDKITSTTQVVFVDGYDANGNRIATSAVSTAVILPATSGTITPATYKIPADRTLTATYTGDVKTVKVTINGTVYTGGTVSGGNVSFYIGDKITSTSDVVKITALDAYGRTLQTKDVTIQSSVVIPNVVTPATFTIGTSYLTGTYSGNVKTVKVKINDVVYSGGTVEDGKISFYIGNKITSVSDSVIIYGYDANGTQVDMKTVTVARPAVGTGTVTPATFTTPGSTNLTGTYTGDVKTIVVNINGTDYTGGTVADGAFTFWIGTKITSVDDVVKVKGLDANQNVIDTKTVTIAAAQPDEGTITPATFSLRTSSITGAYTGPGKSLRVTVNGVALPVGGAVANNNFSYYVGLKNKVTSTSDVVKIALLDKNGLVMEEKPVTIVD